MRHWPSYGGQSRVFSGGAAVGRLLGAVSVGLAWQHRAVAAGHPKACGRQGCQVASITNYFMPVLKRLAAALAFQIAVMAEGSTVV